MTISLRLPHHHPAEPSKRKKEPGKKETPTIRIITQQPQTTLSPIFVISYMLLSFDCPCHQRYQHFVNTIDHNRNMNQLQVQQFPIRTEIQWAA